jgi:hypothetical protein
MEDVAIWVERLGRHCGRFRYFADLTPTSYFQAVAKPLLSIKATGSTRTLLPRSVELNLRLKSESLRSVKTTLRKVDPNDA